MGRATAEKTIGLGRTRRRTRPPFPSELERYFDRPVCDPAHEPLRLFGQWAGIIQPDQTTEVDLDPPYDLELLVSVASAPEYEGADLIVRVPTSAGAS